jgi:hypothetical protein
MLKKIAIFFAFFSLCSASEAEDKDEIKNVVCGLCDAIKNNDSKSAATFFYFSEKEHERAIHSYLKYIVTMRAFTEYVKANSDEKEVHSVFESHLSRYTLSDQSIEITKLRVKKNSTHSFESNSCTLTIDWKDEDIYKAFFRVRAYNLICIKGKWLLDASKCIDVISSGNENHGVFITTMDKASALYSEAIVKLIAKNGTIKSNDLKLVIDEFTK